MQRINQADLERLVVAINTMTGNAKEPYAKRVEGERLKANAGNYHLSYAYGGVALEQMCEGGGVRRISSTGYGTKRELYNWMQSFISGYVKREDKPASVAKVDEMKGGGFLNMPVRFFMYDTEAEDGEGDLRECTEDEFEACEYPISYERNTVHANGCRQICLTKMPRG